MLASTVSSPSLPPGFPLLRACPPIAPDEGSCLWYLLLPLLEVGAPLLFANLSEGLWLRHDVHLRGLLDAGKSI